ncbi:MAG: sigma-54-dependent Fis family transcriptional regulator [Nitrospirae bacterium]|nr:sigma-54-dependent Fis family transcriptional regulator [Candidatus Manganitrophaceae bacterium]
MSDVRILIIEDDPPVRALVSELLARGGYQVETAPDGLKALSLIKQSPYQLYLIDYHLPGVNGIDVMKEIKRIDPLAVCIIMTANGTVTLSVRAMKSGAFDFITKPFDNESVLSGIKNGVAYGRLKQENLTLKKIICEKYQFQNMIGESPPMHGIYDLISRVSNSDSTILIQGESGTGKEIVAKTIHYNSTRRDMPLISVNCGAIPESLLESELFGHEKGAFTGAVTSRMGRFELAEGGTLFLDEISELPLSLQVKLLRVLQERSFERVGGTQTIHVDVRIIAATNQDLERAVEENHFRKDLFYRLNVIPIVMPSLRQRKEDIPLLIAHFIQRLKDKKPHKIEGVSPDAMKLLLDYPWPGNIRELENFIERLVILKQEGFIQPADLPETLTKGQERRLLFQFDLPEEGANFFELVSEFENQLLQQALLKANGVKNRAAQLLRMNRTTLVEKLKRRWASDAAWDSPSSDTEGPRKSLSAGNPI